MSSLRKLKRRIWRKADRQFQEENPGKPIRFKPFIERYAAGEFTLSGAYAKRKNGNGNKEESSKKDRS